MPLPGWARRGLELCAAAVPAAAGDAAARRSWRIFGLATDSQLLGVVLGAINVGLAWRMTTAPHAASRGGRAGHDLLRLWHGRTGTPRCCRRPGSWPTSSPSRSRSWASPSRSTGSGANGPCRTVRATRARPRREPRARVVAAFEGSSMFLNWYRRARPHFEPVQFMAGFVFGVAALARLTVIFAAPFFLFVGPGGSIMQVAARPPRWAPSSPSRCCSSTTSYRPATSSTRPTTTCTTPSTWATCRPALRSTPTWASRTSATSR